MRSAIVVALVGLVGGGAPAHADEAGANRAAADAQARATAGDFFGAATKYREAFREHPRPDLMCNVGVAYYKAKDLPRAHRYLDQCLAIGGSLDPTFIANVKKVLTAVEQKLATEQFKPLNLVVQPQSATSTFDGTVHDEPFVGSRRMWVPFGTYRVTVHAEGFQDRIVEISADNAQPGEFSIKLAPATVAPPPPDVRPDDKPDPTLDPKPDPQITAPLTKEAPEPEKRSIVMPVVASAATGAFGGLALGFYLSARDEAKVATEQANGGDSTRYAEAKDAAFTRRNIAIGFAVAGGAAAIAAGYLWYRATRSPSRVEVGASVSASGGGASLSVRW